MSWFNVPYSKTVVEREENKFKRTWGKKVKKISEIQEYESLPNEYDNIIAEITTIDENKDEKVDIDEKEEDM